MGEHKGNSNTRQPRLSKDDDGYVGVRKMENGTSANLPCHDKGVAL